MAERSMELDSCIVLSRSVHRKEGPGNATIPLCFANTSYLPGRCECDEPPFTTESQPTSLGKPWQQSTPRIWRTLGLEQSAHDKDLPSWPLCGNKGILTKRAGLV
jgi:hypothetical protein